MTRRRSIRRRRSSTLVRLGKLLGVLVVAAAVLLGLGALGLVVLGEPEYEIEVPAVEIDASPEQVARGRRLTLMLCTSCHYSSNERRLQGRRMTHVPWGLDEIQTPNLTQDEQTGIGGWTDGELAFALRTGINPKTRKLMLPLMPRWPRLATRDVEAIIAYLRSDDPLLEATTVEEERPVSLRTTFLAYAHWDTLPYPRKEIPRPDDDDPVVYGEYLVDAVLQCHRCHSESRDSIEFVDARDTPGYLGGGTAFPGLAVSPIVGANLTPHASGIGGWTVADLRRALVEGFRPDGTVIRWPMRIHRGLDEGDVEAIYAYLSSVSPIDNEVARAEPKTLGARADAGMHAFATYGCVHCHGADGRGIVDLRGLDEAFPTDEALVAFLKNPRETYPDTVMPAWDGVIEESDYAPLCEVVRRLSKETEAALGAR